MNFLDVTEDKGTYTECPKKRVHSTAHEVQCISSNITTYKTLVYPEYLKLNYSSL